MEWKVPRAPSSAAVKLAQDKGEKGDKTDKGAEKGEKGDKGDKGTSAFATLISVLRKGDDKERDRDGRVRCPLLSSPLFPLCVCGELR